MTRIAVLALVVGLTDTPRAEAQGRGGSPPWSTTASDAQRTASVKSDPKLTKESVAKDFRFLWKRTLDNQPKQLDALTQPLLLPNIISYKGKCGRRWSRVRDRWHGLRRNR